MLGRLAAGRWASCLLFSVFHLAPRLSSVIDCTFFVQDIEHRSISTRYTVAHGMNNQSDGSVAAANQASDLPEPAPFVPEITPVHWSYIPEDLQERFASFCETILAFDNERNKSEDLGQLCQLVRQEVTMHPVFAQTIPTVYDDENLSIL